jgi:hypothetical protein
MGPGIIIILKKSFTKKIKKNPETSGIFYQPFMKNISGCTFVQQNRQEKITGRIQKNIPDPPEQMCSSDPPNSPIHQTFGLPEDTDMPGNSAGSDGYFTDTPHYSVLITLPAQFSLTGRGNDIWVRLPTSPPSQSGKSRRPSP